MKCNKLHVATGNKSDEQSEQAIHTESLTAYEKAQRKRAAIIFDPRDSDSHNQNEVNIMKNFR